MPQQANHKAARFTRGLVMIMLTAVVPAWAAGKLGEAKDVSFKATLDGSTQYYMELQPDGFDPAKEHHLLIALHGHGSDRHQFASGTLDEGRAARDIAAKYDMIYISPDYRATTSWMGPQAEADMVQIISDLRQQYKIGKVFLTGASMGGSSVLTFAALHPDLIAGVASQNGTANHLEYKMFQEYISASYGGTKQQVPQEFKKRSAEYWPENFTMPVAIAAGGTDTLVPAPSVLRLANILKELGRKVLLIYRENGGHSTDYADTTASLEYVICTALGLELKDPQAVASAGGLFFAGGRPALTDAAGAVDLGLQFSVQKAGVLTALYFFKAQGEAEMKHTLRIWDAKAAILLTLETANETGGGWQKIPLAKPFTVNAGETYTISYTAVSHYPATAGAFGAPIVKDGLTALAGTYTFDDLGKTMPAKTHQSMSYGIDVDYQPNP